MEQALRRELEDLCVEVKNDRTVEKLCEVGRKQGLKPAELVEEWVSFSCSHEDCPLDSYNIERFSSQLMSRQVKQHTPVSCRTVSRTQTTPTSTTIYSKESLNELFGGALEDDDNDNNDLMSVYGGTPTQKMKGAKRTMISPVTPVSKVRHTPASNNTPKSQMMEESSPTSYLSETPISKYTSRSNKGKAICTYNDDILIQGVGSDEIVSVELYDNTSSLTSVSRHMYQRNTERIAVLIDRLEELGGGICEHNGLPDIRETASFSDLSLENVVYVGRVACEGEGRLNPHSCILEGIDSFRTRKGVSVRLDIPETLHPCSLFPGQVIAVEGILTHSKIILPTKIYDEGSFPPLPKRSPTISTIGGVSMMIAAGPYTTSDNLEMIPLFDLLSHVTNYKPNILIMLGPFMDVTHTSIQDWKLDISYDEFLLKEILSPIVKCCYKSNTKVVIVPSQRDVSQQWMVYPQPPFSFPDEVQKKLSDVVMFVSDPAILSINGVCVGVSSTDILFHLSSTAMFTGSHTDRMARLTAHILQQQSFYPLYPSFHHEDQSGIHNNPYTTHLLDVNLDLLLAYDSGHVLLPVRPDVLILTSDLKPFVKVIEGCVCVNTGHLTKKAGGGTYTRLCVQKTHQTDISGQTGIQIMHI